MHRDHSCGPLPLVTTTTVLLPVQKNSRRFFLILIHAELIDCQPSKQPTVALNKRAGHRLGLRICIRSSASHLQGVKYISPAQLTKLASSNTYQRDLTGGEPVLPTPAPAYSPLKSPITSNILGSLTISSPGRRTQSPRGSGSTNERQHRGTESIRWVAKEPAGKRQTRPSRRRTYGEAALRVQSNINTPRPSSSCRTQTAYQSTVRPNCSESLLR